MPRNIIILAFVWTVADSFLLLTLKRTLEVYERAGIRQVLPSQIIPYLIVVVWVSICVLVYTLIKRKASKVVALSVLVAVMMLISGLFIGLTKVASSKSFDSPSRIDR